VARTTDELLESIKISGVVPANQQLLTDLRILSLCNEEVESKIVPKIQALNQDYFVTAETVPLVAYQSVVNIPTRAIGRTLRDIKVIDRGGITRNLKLIQLENAELYRYDAEPGSFYFQGDKVILNPAAPYGVTASLVLYYLQRPGRLVPTSFCSRITGVATDNETFTTFTVDQVPAGFTSNAVCDFIEGNSGNSTLDKDKAITDISGAQITFGVVDPLVKIGDYIAPQYCSPVLQFPEDAFSYLVCLAGVRCLRALGDVEGAESLGKEIKEKREDFETLLAPRISGETIKIVNPNGLLRGMGRGRGRFFYR